ncbi:MAG: serine/threonine protein kinase [Planctomycetes bacterium]|nr:serine/threonine protein kinase [Planctomycetota bacterium]
MTKISLPADWQLERLLGTSPLSEVFLVRNPAGEKRALKLLRAQPGKDPRIRERWRREAELLAEIGHPQLVGCAGTMEVDGRFGLNLEYIEGPTLRDRLRLGGMEWEQVARIGVQVARALEALHGRQAIHRDVKPHNILLHPKRGAVLADLGLVRRLEDPELTRQGAALGSPAYMSPEQAMDPTELGPATDVYSLAATMHHALAGRPPFEGKGVGEVLHRVLHESPHPLPHSLPEPLRKVLFLALAKDEADRYPSAREFRQDLARVLTGSDPLLVSAQAMKKRNRVLVGAGSLVILLGGTVWWSEGWISKPEIPGIETTSLEIEDPSSDVPSVSATQSSAPRAGGAAFEGWAEPFQSVIRVHLSDQELLRAREELAVFRRVGLPPAVATDFGELRSQRADQLWDELLAVEESIRGVVQFQLKSAAQICRSSMQTGHVPDLDRWEQEVLRGWDLEAPGWRELTPLSSRLTPTQELAQSRLVLEEQRTRTLVTLGEDLIPTKRSEVQDALRAGNWDEAVQAWSRVDPELLEFSAGGQRESKRLQLVEQWASLGLTSSWARIQPRLQGTPSELQFARAHWLWLRGDTPQAVELMKPLAAEVWSAEWGPRAWLLEWRRELAWETHSVPLVGQPNHLQLEPAVSQEEEGPFAELIASLAVDSPSARVELFGRELQLEWRAPLLTPAWSQSIGWDRTQFEVVAWGVEWQLPSRQKPPRLFLVMDEVEFLQPAPSQPPIMRVRGSERRGLGVIPGAAQSLVWRDGSLRLDDLEVGSLPSLNGNRLRLQLEALPSFQVSRVWARIRLRNSGN